MSLLPRLLLSISLIATPGLSFAEGYLALKPEKLPDMVLGLGEAGFGLSQFFVPIRPGEYAWRCKGLEQGHGGQVHR